MDRQQKLLAALCGYAGGLTAQVVALMIFIDGNPGQPGATVLAASLVGVSGLVALVGSTLMWTHRIRWAGYALVGAGVTASLPAWFWLVGLVMLIAQPGLAGIASLAAAFIIFGIACIPAVLMLAAAWLVLRTPRSSPAAAARL